MEAVKNIPELRFPEFEGEWVLKKTKEIAPLQRGFDLTNANIKDGDYPVVFSNGILRYHSEKRVNGPGVVTGRSGTIGKVTYVDIDYWPHNTSLWVTDFKCNFPKFIYFFYCNFKLDRFNAGSAVPTLNRNDVHIIKKAIPSMPEQIKIAKFLTTVDNKIQQLTKKKELLEQYKKGVMQKIFNQEIRFKDDDGKEFPDWEETKIGNVFKERSENNFSDMELLSISINAGIYAQSESNKRDNSNKDKSKYKRVLKGDIAYNSMRMWQGASGVSELDGIISPAYTVLKTIGKQNVYFFGYIFKMNFMIQIFQKNSQGLTSDTWNLKYPMISMIKLKVPVLREQNMIVKFLKQLDFKIEYIDYQINNNNSYKKGLLQKMLV